MEYFLNFSLEKLAVCESQLTPMCRQQVKTRTVGYNESTIIMRRMVFEFVEQEPVMLFAHPRIVQEKDLSTASIRVYLNESVAMWSKRMAAYLLENMSSEPVYAVVTHIYVYESYADIHFFEVQHSIIDRLVRIDIIDHLLADL